MIARFLTRCGCESYQQVSCPPPPYWIIALRLPPLSTFRPEEEIGVIAREERRFELRGVDRRLNRRGRFEEVPVYLECQA
jgi:hypothetical protein